MIVEDVVSQDGNGFINRVELRHVMMNLGERMTEKECDALVDVRFKIIAFYFALKAKKNSIEFALPAKDT